MSDTSSDATEQEPRADVVTIDVEGCARCHGDGHPGLTFQRMEHPVVLEGHVYPYFALCPTRGEPILMTYIPMTSDDGEREQ
jgi:hypothetical protein